MPSNFTCCGCWPTFVRTVQDTSGTGRRYRRAKYNEREYSIEFENLVEEEDFYPPASHVVTEVERDLLAKGRFRELYQHESSIAQQQDERLRETEENARLEDEAYIQAKREAARVAKQTLNKTNSANLKKKLDSAEFSKWLTEENIDINSSELDAEDFESFLEKVRARGSAAATNGAAAFEQTLTQGLAATKIAGDALNALQPVELHAVSDIGSLAATQDPLPHGLLQDDNSSAPVLTTNAQVNFSNVTVNSPIVSQPMAAPKEDIFGGMSDNTALVSDLPEADLSMSSSQAHSSAAQWTAVFNASTSVEAGVNVIDVASNKGPVVTATEESILGSPLIVESSTVNTSSLIVDFPLSAESSITGQGGKLVSPLEDEAPSLPQPQSQLLPQPQAKEGELRPSPSESLSHAQPPVEEERVSVDVGAATGTKAIIEEVTNTTSKIVDVVDTNIVDPTLAESISVKVVDPILNHAEMAMLNHQNSGVAVENSKSGSDDDFCDFDDEFAESSSGMAFEEYLA